MPVLKGFENKTAVTIAINDSKSDQFQIAGCRGLCVETPAVWTAADIGLEVSDDNIATAASASTWVPVYTNTGALHCKVTGVKTSSTGSYIFPAEAWQIETWHKGRLCSLDTADGTAEVQAAARVLYVRKLS